ncbi:MULTISPECIES: hypothetical protein [unclassified Cupriavidus]|uniref:hypothetical protein n=1 Tax=unclassified Cupriavidus TaxID=2640874 RepID=UPI001BFFF668|nr:MULTISPECIES: hypothetical protein [unclassified Cupriavidus]MCA3182748.1 hypothetical protein [Cupriavidus sp.]MCA3189810.1 hypothetical protein [Cupriavidus sp.]MCA3196404.1 hypothetical protein [Cupriavidus sp.]MCA3202149.1 hypothetical protein [Cupriavidus sp.]MCA3231924.1 hypothetical protein [Cupriavidus sp.]
MSVPDQPTIFQYTGNGITTTFPYGCYVLDEEDLVVSVDDDTITTGFTVNGIGSQTGGAVIFAVPPADGAIVVLMRQVDISRSNDYQRLGDLRADTLNLDFDRIWMALQDFLRDKRSSLRYPLVENLDGQLAPRGMRASKMLGFDDNGRHTYLPVPASVGAGDMVVNSFYSASGHYVPGTTTTLTLSRPPGVPGNVEVFFGPAYQGPNQWLLSGNQVIFNSPIPVGVDEVFIRIGTTLSVVTPPDQSVGDDQLQWGNIMLRVVDTVADLRNLDSSRYRVVMTLGYRTPGDGGSGFYRTDMTDTSTADNGGTVIVADDAGRYKLMYDGSVNAMQFGAKRGDLSFDSTSAFNALVLDAIAKGYTADFGSGLFRVSSILIPAGNLHITGSATILGKTSGNYDAVLEIRDAVDLQIDGSMIFSAVYNLGYKCGVKVWGNDGIVSLVNIYGLSVTGARKAWIIGDETKTDKQVSELVIYGGYTFGCPIACAAYGTQTFVEFNGYQLRSSYGDGAGAWLALDARVVLAVGAHVRQVGGEHLMTELTVGAGVELDPIDGSFANQYGSFEAHGTVIECAAPFAITGNPGVSSPIRGLLSYMGCTGIHTQNLQALIQTDADFQGKIICKGNQFYSTTPRSFANIACLGNADVHCDDTSFGDNFPQGIGGISGGIAHFSERVIARVSNLGGATIPAGTSTLKWQSADNTGDLARPTVSYNPTTGALTFNQPVKKARVIGGFFLAGITGTSTILTKFNNGGGPATRGIQFVGTGICANIGDVNTGDIIFIDCNNTGSGLAAGSNAYDFIEVIASN